MKWEIWTTEPANSDTRWANQPKWLTKEASSTETKGFDSSCGDGWVSIDSRNFFQRTASSESTRGHMGIRATNEADQKQWKEFRSRNAADTSQVPYSTITYKKGDTEFGVMAGEGITVGEELSGDELAARLSQMGYTSTTVNQAMETPSPDRTAEDADVVPGTPEDSQVDPADNTLFNQAWTDMAQEGESSTPPPVISDVPSSVRGAAKYTAVPAESDDIDPGQGPISAMASNPYSRIAAWREKRGVHTVLRNGVYVRHPDGKETGHNLEKIERKHNLNTRVLKIVTKRPEYYWHVSGKSGIMRATRCTT